MRCGLVPVNGATEPNLTVSLHRELALIGLNSLMAASAGAPDVSIGLIDGPVAASHPHLAKARLRAIGSSAALSPGRSNGSIACMHGTFVAGILVGRRDASTPGLAPDCTLFVRPIFTEDGDARLGVPTARPEELAAAIIECVLSGAHVINVSVALRNLTAAAETAIEQALDLAAHRGVLVMSAAGNEGTLAGSVLSRHPWVVPVVACDLLSRPIAQADVGASISRTGLMAPGKDITRLGVDGSPLTLSGSSAAVPFVSGTAALLLSIFSHASPAALKFALTNATVRGRGLAPGLLDATAAAGMLART
jgi:subtilisin family serine protease